MVTVREIVDDAYAQGVAQWNQFVRELATESEYDPILQRSLKYAKSGLNESGVFDALVNTARDIVDV